MTGTKTYFVV